MILMGNPKSRIDYYIDYMQSFCETYGLKSVIETPICYLNPENPFHLEIIESNNYHK